MEKQVTTFNCVFIIIHYKCDWILEPLRVYSKGVSKTKTLEPKASWTEASETYRWAVFDSDA